MEAESIAGDRVAGGSKYPFAPWRETDKPSRSALVGEKVSVNVRQITFDFLRTSIVFEVKDETFLAEKIGDPRLSLGKLVFLLGKWHLLIGFRRFPINFKDDPLQILRPGLRSDDLAHWLCLFHRIKIGRAIEG
ncbi:MAG TPA: hypothetical protein PKD26_12800 [Pyrinomonadaceae bacterium]|nr:hypothetical protein [Pyrinomonadaceae bacterium]